MGPYRLENRIDAFCNGASNLTIWAIWDCSRNAQQLEAGSNKEWLSDDDDMDGRVPTVTTYACPIGESLPANANFVMNLSNYFRIDL